jgi:hypothetical protein
MGHATYTAEMKAKMFLAENLKLKDHMVDTGFNLILRGILSKQNVKL